MGPSLSLRLGWVGASEPSAMPGVERDALRGLGQAYRLALSYAESSVEFSSVPSAGI